MKYIVIEIMGNGEIEYVNVGFEGDIFIFKGEDTSRLGRQLHYWLANHGFAINNKTGKIEVLAFGIAPLYLLCNMTTLFRYIDFIGGIHNPVILYVKNKQYLPMICELSNKTGLAAIDELVRQGIN